jgi:hypothetical protein
MPDPKMDLPSSESYPERGIDSTDRRFRVRHRVIAYTFLIAVMVFILYFLGPVTDLVASLWGIAFVIVFSIVLIAGIVYAILGGRPGEGSFLIINLVVAFAFGVYGYYFTMEFSFHLFPINIQLVALLVGFGCSFLQFLGFALAAR